MNLGGLIGELRMRLVDAEAMLEGGGARPAPSKHRLQCGPRGVESRESKILAAQRGKPCDLGELYEVTGGSKNALSVMLTRMKREGKIVSEGGHGRSVYSLVEVMA